MFFQVFKKEKLYLGFRIFDREGNPVKVLKLLLSEIRVIGPKMPFLEMKKGPDGRCFDGGIRLPEGTVDIEWKEGARHYDIVEAYLKKVEDATIAYVYGLDKPGMFIVQIERVPVPGAKKPLFTPRVHYSNGSKVDINQQVIANDPQGNYLRYFDFDKKTEDIYFTNFSLIRQSKFSKGHFYLNFMFEIPFNQRTREARREKGQTETPAHKTPSTWGIDIPQVKKVDGTWRIDEPPINKYPTMNCITGPGQHASFMGNVMISVGDIYPGEQFSLQFEGNAHFISDIGGKTTDPYAPFSGMGEEGIVKSSSPSPGYGAEFA